jgi:hypothetical protein
MHSISIGMLPSVSGHWGVTDRSYKGGRPRGLDRVVYV